MSRQKAAGWASDRTSRLRVVVGSGASEKPIPEPGIVATHEPAIGSNKISHTTCKSAARERRTWTQISQEVRKILGEVRQTRSDRGRREVALRQPVIQHLLPIQQRGSGRLLGG